MDALTPSISDRALRPPKELLVAWMLLLIDVGEDHGYTLHHGLLDCGIDLQATTVYRWLAKFERDGWVLSDWSEPIDGPRRHVYRLTQDGYAALREMTELTAAIATATTRFWMPTHRRSRAVAAASSTRRRCRSCAMARRRHPTCPSRWRRYRRRSERCVRTASC